MNFLRITIAAVMVGLLWSCSSPSESQEETSLPTSSKSEETETMPVEMTQMVEQGKTVYGQYCVACHQVDGNGMSGAFPPLTQTKWVEGDNAELISVLLNGMEGEITVKGEKYNNVMPKHDFLSDEDIAAVLTYVRQSFGNSASEITAAEVTEARGSTEGDSAN